MNSDIEGAPMQQNELVQALAEGLWAQSRKQMGLRADYMPASRTDFKAKATDEIDRLRATTNDAPVERLVDAAYFLLSEIDASNDAEHIKGASGPLRAALAAITTAPTAPVDREAAKQALRRWHRDTCYPDASDGELEIGLDAIVSLLPSDREGSGK